MDKNNTQQEITPRLSEAILKDLKLLRIRHKLTLRQVEETTGISNAYLSQLENGKIKKPSYDVIEKLLTLYAVVNTPLVCHCPCCKSVNVVDASQFKSNGVIGPGSKSWKTFDAMSCSDCGIYFKQLSGNGKP